MPSSQVYKIDLCTLYETVFASSILVWMNSLYIWLCYWTKYWFSYCQVSLTQARIDMSELDEDSDGFLQPHVSHLYVLLDRFVYFLSYKVPSLYVTYLFSIDTNEMIFCNHTGNGRLYSRSYSKFGTTPGYSWCLCTYVLPNSSPQIFLLLWPS